MKLSASQVSLILKRAAEIDARGESMTAEELERIASEAGIDPQATRTAIAEFVAEEIAVPAPAPVRETGPPVAAPSAGNRTAPSPGRIVAGGAIGVACGFLFSLLEMGAVAAGLGTMVVYVILRAVQGMKRGSQLDFQLQNFTLWFGAALIASLALGPEGFAFFLVAWVLTSIGGGLLVRFGPREEQPEPEIPRLEHEDR